MAALTASAIVRSHGKFQQRYQIRNAATVFHGGLGCVVDQSAATAANRGRMTMFTGAAGEVPVGLVMPDQNVDRDGYVGDTAATPIRDAGISIEGAVLENVSVAGATVVTDSVGRVVYFNDTDNPEDLTLTRPTRGVPIGLVLRFLTGDNCDVLLFSLETIFTIGMGGSGQELLYLGSFDAATVAAGNLRTGIPMPFHGRFLTLAAMVDVAIAGAGGTALINLETDAVDVTGGVVTVSTAAGGVKGTRLAGTAITAANFFSEGSLLDVEAATVTAMTAGRFDLYAEVERLPGA